jgi:acetoin utilization deacetylase AcuC-like enzyme
MCRHVKSRQVIENEGKRKPRFSLFRGEKCHGRHFSRSPSKHTDAPGTDDRLFFTAWDEVESFVERARPEFILLQCGAGGIAGGPITHMTYRSVAHRHATRSLGALAESHCNGRLLGPGGGGCHLANLANAWCAVVEAMLDADNSS